MLLQLLRVTFLKLYLRQCNMYCAKCASRQLIFATASSFSILLIYELIYLFVLVTCLHILILGFISALDVRHIVNLGNSHLLCPIC